MVTAVFFSQLFKRGSVRSTLAAVVLLQLKFSQPFTNVTICFLSFNLESSISFLMSIFRRNLTLPFLDASSVVSVTISRLSILANQH